MRAGRSNPSVHRHVFGLFVVIALVSAACSGDDEGSKEAFCVLAEQQNEAGGLDFETPEGSNRIEALVDQAPGDIRDKVVLLRDGAREFSEIDRDDPGELAGAVDLLRDPELIGAIRDISIYMADDCGIAIENIDEIRQIDADDPDALIDRLTPTTTG